VPVHLLHLQVALLWFKRKLPKYASKFIEM
jgi:hypothetical protein